MNLTSAMLGAVITGITLPTILKVSMIPIITSAKAANFQAAEMQATMFMTSALSQNELPEPPDECELTTDDNETFNYTIRCTVGSTPQVVAVAGRNFSLLNPDGQTASGLGVYTDDDLDGFDDVTGLFTHYAECYSGWKGSGSLKNNCELGGPYVIPAYAHLY